MSGCEAPEAYERWLAEAGFVHIRRRLPFNPIGHWEYYACAFHAPTSRRAAVARCHRRLGPTDFWTSPTTRGMDFVAIKPLAAPTALDVADAWRARLAS